MAKEWRLVPFNDRWITEYGARTGDSLPSAECEAIAFVVAHTEGGHDGRVALARTVSLMSAGTSLAHHNKAHTYGRVARLKRKRATSMSSSGGGHRLCPPPFAPV